MEKKGGIVVITDGKAHHYTSRQPLLPICSRNLAT